MKYAVIAVGLVVTACGGSDAAEDIPCEAGKRPCDGVCVNPLFDATNCGACGRVCSHEMGCFGGTCTGPAQISAPRMDVAVVTGKDGRIYAIGGWEHSAPGSPHWDKVSDASEAYDPETNQWELLDSLSQARCCSAALASSEHVLAIGGGTLSDVVGTVERYKNHIWEPATPLNTNRSHAAAAVDLDGRAWLFGGVGVNGLLATEAFLALGATSWTEQPMMSAQPRWGARAVTAPAGKIFVIGGSTLAAPFAGVSTVDVFDPSDDAAGASTQAWSFAPPMNIGRTLGGAALGADGRIYYAGGYGPDREPLDSVERYDPATNQWSFVEPLPCAVGFVSAAADRFGRIYLVGGQSGPVSASETRAVLLVYDIAANRWYQ